jgi:hypothetical protein
MQMDSSGCYFGRIFPLALPFYTHHVVDGGWHLPMATSGVGGAPTENQLVKK